MKQLFHLIILGLVLTTKVNAHTEMRVQIHNNTDTSCQLIDKKIIHGNYSTWQGLSDVLLPQETQAFVIDSSFFYGPHIQLNYRCGENRIANFKLQQEYAFYSLSSDSRPQLTVLEVKELILTSKFYDNTPGVISISINK